jgi:hypothetical protein
LREEQERQKEFHLIQQKLRSDKEAVLQTLATERAERERLEALRREVDSRQVAVPLKRKLDAPVARAAQRPRLNVVRKYGHTCKISHFSVILLLFSLKVI